MGNIVNRMKLEVDVYENGEIRLVGSNRLLGQVNDAEMKNLGSVFSFQESVDVFNQTNFKMRDVLQRTITKLKNIK